MPPVTLTPNHAGAPAFARRQGVHHDWELELRTTLARGTPIVFDLAHNGYLDMSSLGVLVRVTRLARDLGVSFVVTGLDEDTRTYLLDHGYAAALTFSPPLPASLPVAA